MDKDKVFGELKKEREKIASLKGREKAEYLWEYYWPALAVLLGIFLAAGGIYSGVSKAGEKVLLSVAVIDADREKTEAFETLGENLSDFLGEGRRRECVILDTSAASGGQPEEEINVVMKLSVVEEHDIIILNETLWEKFQREDAFLDWEEVLGDSYAKYASHIKGSALFVSESKRWQAVEYVQYEPACLCVLKTSPRKENAGRAAEFFFP